ncbi:DUF2798 domain-containing protein [Gaetbulibacter sp. M235]|uniref:DUF2798 domain-containing protein n=1 Tax=Gaetbulibacter sp. M235 TaxID=3126510 RepID=UPI00374F6620
MTRSKLKHSAFLAIFTTSYITFTIIAVNIGFVYNFIFIWLRSWLIAIFLSLPSLLFITPVIEKHIKNKINK